MLDWYLRCQCKLMVVYVNIFEYVNKYRCVGICIHRCVCGYIHMYVCVLFPGAAHRKTGSNENLAATAVPAIAYQQYQQ